MNEKNTNVIDLTKYIKETPVADKKSFGSKYQSNPIFKKNLIISVKNNTHKFSVSDLFD